MLEEYGGDINKKFAYDFLKLIEIINVRNKQAFDKIDDFRNSFSTLPKEHQVYSSDIDEAVKTFKNLADGINLAYDKFSEFMREAREKESFDVVERLDYFYLAQPDYEDAANYVLTLAGALSARFGEDATTEMVDALSLLSRSIMSLSYLIKMALSDNG